MSPDSGTDNYVRQSTFLKARLNHLPIRTTAAAERKVKASVLSLVASAFTAQVGQPSLMHCQRSH